MVGYKKMEASVDIQPIQIEATTAPLRFSDIPLTIRTHERRRVVQNSAHLILAIEKTLVACVHDKPLVDDQVAARAVTYAIQHAFDESEAVSFVISKLALTAAELEVADLEWCDALRVVLAAIRNQSDLETGEYTYLIYTSALIAAKKIVQI